MTHIRPDPHEVKAELVYPEHGASPYWALWTIFSNVARQTLQRDFEIEGETWTITGNIQESGLAPRESDDVSKLYEYRFNAEGPNQKTIPLKFAPRWQNMTKASDGSKANVPIPPDVEEAVGVSIQSGVNLLLDEYERLIPKIVAAVAEELGYDWNPDYFQDVHPDSRIVEFELYVRVRRKIGRKLIASDGIFNRLVECVGNPEGSLVHYSQDNREIKGWNHQLRLNQRSMQEIFPTEPGPRDRLGVQLKQYYPRNPDQFDMDDALYHPKVGVLFAKRFNKRAFR